MPWWQIILLDASWLSIDTSVQLVTSQRESVEGLLIDRCAGGISAE